MTPDSQHRILRQVVELVGCRREDAAALQAAAARLSQRDWLPVMSAVCSTLGDAGRVRRIDRLEVDLGTLPAAAWLAAAPAAQAGETTDRLVAGPAANALAQQFERAFSAQLAVALEQAAEVQTAAELLTSFLASGVLPWWADAGDRQSVVRAATAQLRQPAAVWRQWLGRDGGRAPNEPALLRLVTALPDDLLAELLAEMLAHPLAHPLADRPSGATTAPIDGWTMARQASWLATINHAAAATGQPAVRWRRAWWQAALTSALWPAGDRSGWAALLPPWLARLGLPEATLRPALRRALDQVLARDAGAAEWAALWRALQPPDGAMLAASQPADAAWQQLLATLAAAAATPTATPSAGPAATGPARRHLHQRLVRASAHGVPAAAALPPALRRAAADAWARLADPAPGSPGAAAPGRGPATTAADRLAALAAALARLLQHAVKQGLIDPAAAGLAGGADAVARQAAAWAAAAWADRWGPAGRAGTPLAPVAAMPAPWPVAAPPSPPATAAVDALYVAHAGLVLLWPFIQRFADRLGLLRAGKPVRWRDANSASRAAVGLHCVISGDAAPPEFQLALPKLLCGLPLDEPLLLDEPLSDAEQAECETLLVAAIAQAPILRQMSVAGFRGSFGLRPGQLSTRDGHWLLRVERQAYDVVIDRFPWSAGLVRLPWMPTLLQVQW